MKRLFVFLAGALLLATCTVNNPVNNNTEATAESAYSAAAELATAYLSLSFCAAGKHFTVIVPCKETAVIRSVKKADNTAYTALIKLRSFHQANPGNTVSELALIGAVVDAATALKATNPLKS